MRVIESAPRCLRKEKLLRGHKRMEKERDYYCTSRIASTLMHRQREGTEYTPNGGLDYEFVAAECA